jgi:phosphoglycolate phosphatase
VIFDLDGTLVDTAPDLLSALNHVLAQFGDARLELGQVRQMVGQGARALVVEGMKSLDIAKTEAEIDQLTEIFLVYYVENVANESKLFPGLSSHLPRYLDEGHRLGVCTNKLEAPSRKLLRAIGVHDFFHSIVGRDTLSTQKPDPAPLLHAIETAGGARDHTVFIGDSITDVLTAKAASIPCVLVSFGYTVTPVTELGGDIIIDHFDELDAAIERLL